MGPAGPQGIRPQKSEKTEGEDDTRETARHIRCTLKERVSPFVFFIRSRQEQLITGLPVPAGGLAAAHFQFARPAGADYFAAGS
jgi:hypothetical protein